MAFGLTSFSLRFSSDSAATAAEHAAGLHVCSAQSHLGVIHSIPTAIHKSRDVVERCACDVKESPLRMNHGVSNM